METSRTGRRPEAVAQSSPDRHEEELHQAVRGRQKPVDEGGRAEGLGEVGHQRDDDAEAEQVEEDRQGHDPEAGAMSVLRANGPPAFRRLGRKPTLTSGVDGPDILPESGRDGGAGMKVEQAARSHIGKVRQRNEDAWSCWPSRERRRRRRAALLFGVADGMGGHPGGDVASALAVSVLADLGGSSCE